MWMREHNDAWHGFRNQYPSCQEHRVNWLSNLLDLPEALDVTHDEQVRKRSRSSSQHCKQRRNIMQAIVRASFLLSQAAVSFQKEPIRSSRLSD